MVWCVCTVQTASLASETDHLKIINKFTMKQTVSVSPGHPAQLSLVLLIISDINVMRGGREGAGGEEETGPSGEQ